MDAIIEQLRQKPNLNILVDELNEIVKEEKKKRKEFYNNINEDDKAEFINGEVIMHSPVKLEHAEVSGLLLLLMKAYCMKHKSGQVHAEKIMIQLTRNSYEPDIVFFAKEKSKTFTSRQMLFPAPDFIAEILSPSTEGNDRNIKFTDYAIHGVKEYWLIDPAQQSLEQYLLQGDKYELEIKSNSGIVSSKALPGFSIHIKAIFSEAENLEALQQILHP